MTDVEIVVLPHGWVLIGRLEDDGMGDYVLREAAVIRRWGTTGGLGQLALEGKQSGTELDREGTNRIPRGGIIRRIAVTEAAAKTLGYE